MNTIIRRRGLMRGEVSILPQGYKQLESVHKVLNKQINFGSVDVPYTIIAEVAPYFYSTGITRVMFYGAGTYFGLWYDDSGHPASTAKTIGETVMFANKTRALIRGEMKSSNSKYYVNDIDTGLTGGASKWLFGGAINTAGAHGSEFDLYSFKVIKNSSVVVELIPCERKSDGRRGVYDIVNDVFRGDEGVWS